MKMFRPVVFLLCLLVAGFAAGVDRELSATASIQERVKEIKLDNGLRIFVLEDNASPTFAAYFEFGVGGASDPKGRSGIAHLLEHMMFKGSKTLGVLDSNREAELMTRLADLWDQMHLELDKEDDPFNEPDEKRIEELQAEIETITAEHKTLLIKNEYDEILTRAGAVGMNASTSNDITNYFVQLPSNLLEFWFRLESDRLLNSVFREFYSERDVVHEERRMRTENSPFGSTWEALETLMYTAHPYGTPVVGWPRDLLRMTRQDAFDYFTTYYSPSNCVVVLSGDIDAADVEKLAKKWFSPWKRQVIPRLHITEEPPQQGARRRMVEFDAQPSLVMGWPTVSEGHADQAALDVLGTILGGLGSSRLDLTVVLDEKVASSVSAFQNSQRYSGYFMARGNLRSEFAHGDLEKGILREIEKIKTDGVSSEELKRAKIGTEVSRVRSLESNMGLAYEVGYTVGLSGGLDYMSEAENRVYDVTAEDVQRVAKEYLVGNRMNVVELRQTEDAGGAQSRNREFRHQRGGTVSERGAKHSTGFNELMKVVKKAPQVEIKVPEVGKDVTRVKLDCGTTVYIKEDHTAPSVEVGFMWTGGYNTVPLDDLPAYELVSDMLREGGTAALDPVALEQMQEELGMMFWLWVGGTSSGGSFWSLSRNFDESFGVALDMVQKPRFDADRLEVLKNQHIDAMRRRWDSPGRGVRVMRNHVENGDHPRLGFEATRPQIENLTVKDMQAAWSRHLGANNLYLTVVGDFDQKEMLATVEKALCGWRKATETKRDWIKRKPAIHPGVYLVEKEVSAPSIGIGHHIAIDRTASKKDHAAVEILNDILGGSGFRSRLMERLRSDEGLTYGIYSSIDHENRKGVPGSIGIGYSTKKSSVLHSINSVFEEFHAVIDNDVTEWEVGEQVDAWKNRFIFKFTNSYFSVFRLMSHELDDRPKNRDREVLNEIRKVTVKDVRKAAKKYLSPENLTVLIFGNVTDEDRKGLTEKFGSINVLEKDEVFGSSWFEDNSKPAEDSAE